MARTTHVAKAQQRYATVPVIDPETGQQKRTPVMVTGRDGEKVQKVSKRGPVFLSLTVSDKSQPLPNRKCDSCHKEIEVGQAYKHISPKSGPYGGQTRTRHETCPNWQVWEYSSSLSARIAQIQHEGETGIPQDSDEPEDYTSHAESVADEIEGLADEKQESADNIEEGFGHATSSSEELAEQADALHEWADEVRDVEVPDLPEPEEQDCEECDGTGKVEVENPDYDPETDADDMEFITEPCGECDGSGQVTPDEPTDEQMAEWREQAAEALTEAIGNSPL